MTTTPSNNIPFVPENTLDPAAGLNLSLNAIDVLLQLAVLTRGADTPPGAPADGDRHIVGTSPTGDWTGEANRIARYVADGDFWQFYDAVIALNLDDGALYKFIGGAWQELTSSGGVTTFLGQTDTPASYTGEAGKIPKVNTAEGALVFSEKQYGQLNITNNVTALAVTAAVDSTLQDPDDYAQVTGIWDAIPHGETQGITQQTNSITIAEDGVYKLNFWATVSADSNTTRIGVKWGLNGVVGLQRTPITRIANAGDYTNISAHGIHAFTAGDVLTLWHAASNTADVTWIDSVFSAEKISY